MVVTAFERHAPVKRGRVLGRTVDGQVGAVVQAARSGLPGDEQFVGALRKQLADGHAGAHRVERRGAAGFTAGQWRVVECSREFVTGLQVSGALHGFDQRGQYPGGFVTGGPAANFLAVGDQITSRIHQQRAGRVEARQGVGDDGGAQVAGDEILTVFNRVLPVHAAGRAERGGLQIGEQGLGVAIARVNLFQRQGQHGLGPRIQPAAQPQQRLRFQPGFAGFCQYKVLEGQAVQLIIFGGHLRGDQAGPQVLQAGIVRPGRHLKAGIPGADQCPQRVR